MEILLYAFSSSPLLFACSSVQDTIASKVASQLCTATEGLQSMYLSLRIVFLICLRPGIMYVHCMSTGHLSAVEEAKIRLLDSYRPSGQTAEMTAEQI